MRNGSPWPTSVVHFVGCTQPGPNEPTHVSEPKSKGPQQEAEDWEWTTSPCSSLIKEQLKTPTREPSLWGWTRGCPISFLPPSTWCEQCSRVVISVEVLKMMQLHHLPQYYTSSGRGVETKLSKPQWIDAINVKKCSKTWFVCQAHESRKGNIGNMWIGGYKGISNGTSWSRLRVWHLA